MLNNPMRLRQRAAASIRERLLALQEPRTNFSLPEHLWQDCLRFARRIRKAEAYGLTLASRKLRRELPVPLRYLRERVNELTDEMTTWDEPVVPCQRQIYDDLIALAGEFAEVAVDLKRQQVNVTTDPLELESIYLGPFRIELDWRCLGAPSPYEVIAEDPQPAAASDDTTHPHVQDNRLCEGEGRIPIRRALQQGRIFDFFLIVRQVLENYNSASAYVALDRWHGVDCHDCGELVNEDERVRCEGCEGHVCDDCTRSCCDCGHSFCNGCISHCQGCDEPTCHDCLSTDSDSGQDLCEECRSHAACPT